MKICPLMAFNADTDLLVLNNCDGSDDPMQQLADTIKNGNLSASKVKDFEAPAINIIRGACKGADCAWWSEERKCCGVVK